MVKSLLDILREVTLDPEQGAAFGADPSNYLAEQGYTDVADEDLREAFSLVADTLPAEQAHEVYTTHVAQEVGDALSPFPVPDEDPGAVYGNPTDDFDLDIDDATNQVIEPGAEVADESGLGFGAGADDDADLDIAAMHYREDDDSGYDTDDTGYGDDDTGDTGYDDDGVDDHAGLDLDADVNPFDESHDTDLDDDTASHHDMHYRDEDDEQADQHDSGHHDVDLDLGFF